MPVLVKLEDVTKSYKMGEVDIRALESVNLEINKGEFLAIVGPSGSGKSTLMHIIGLLDQPTKGKVYIKNKDVENLSQNEQAVLRNRQIGFVFQSFNLLARTSAQDNVVLPLIYSGLGRHDREKKAKDALKKVGLAKRIHHHPSQLSGGEQQRVAIARALVNNPALILADEPTGNLDSKTGNQIIKLLINLNKIGHTIVLVTHEKKIANKANRIVQIMDGKIISGE